ncbi:hypothetical protein [Lactobacillus crispatus]|uniref:hypothetical protein n=1 Tax=Lactobacillus crispatus TaxID=47770 RepID=UPI0008254AA2|nr:hypothetical protein [Lactobacillus crispatus]OCX09371.1 hypothetical protein BEV10_08275 [Lactobacillus crispatus]
MKQISIDIETYSSTNLNQTGVYRYADSNDFELLLFGYATDFGPVKVVDLTQGEKIPSQVIKALDNPNIIKSAFNAQFERVCLSVSLCRSPFKPGWLALFPRLVRYSRTTFVTARCRKRTRVTTAKDYCW